MGFITLNVAVQFFIPVGVVRGRAVGVTASGVLVPKAPVNEDRRPLAWEHDVRLAGKAGPMKSKSVACPVEEATNFHLRRGVFRLYGAHDRAALFGVEYVHHIMRDSIVLASRGAMARVGSRPHVRKSEKEC